MRVNIPQHRIKCSIDLVAPCRTGNRDLESTLHAIEDIGEIESIEVHCDIVQRMQRADVVTEETLQFRPCLSNQRNWNVGLPVKLSIEFLVVQRPTTRENLEVLPLVLRLARTEERGNLFAKPGPRITHRAITSRGRHGPRRSRDEERAVL